jgi:hypothetical protein
MNRLVPIVVATFGFVGHAASVDYKPAGDWLKLPAGRPTLGNMHGDIAVSSNGDVYVTDGYASDYIHRFHRTAKHIRSFGGKKEPYSFSTLHKLAIDTRFQHARIIACDRANNRVVHLSLDGDHLGVVAKDLLLPAAVTIDGDQRRVLGLAATLGPRITFACGDRRGRTR